MDEFTISFRYNNKEQKATVVKSESDERVEYDVRPEDPDLVKEHGKQIRIFKEEKGFRTPNHISKNSKAYFNRLIEAILNAE